MSPPNVEFIKVVHEIEATRHVSFANAWTLAAAERPDLYVLMRAIGATPRQLATFNARAKPDPAKVRMREELQRELRVEMVNNGGDYERAWGTVRLARRDLRPLMDVPDPREMAAAFVNQAPREEATVPVAGPQTNASLQLNAASSQDEFRIGFEANGRKFSPLNPGRVFAALVSYYERERSISYESAVAFCRERHPVLWGQVEAIGKS